MAEREGARYLNASARAWDKAVKAGNQWEAINRPFLDYAVRNNHVIKFVDDPRGLAASRMLHQEWVYLTETVGYSNVVRGW